MYDRICPGKPWLDTKGNRIQAHAGSVMYLDGLYYWYGENKEKTTGENGIWHRGVRCYTSIFIIGRIKESLFNRKRRILYLPFIQNP